jgi:hypothetical protein
LAFELLTYSILGAIYLISFSEYPREFLAPILLSGPLHFAIRLTQDLLLVRVFGALIEKGTFKSLITRLTYIYLIAIGIFPFLYIIGANSYCLVRARSARSAREFKSTKCLKAAAPVPSAFFAARLLFV